MISVVSNWVKPRLIVVVLTRLLATIYYSKSVVFNSRLKLIFRTSEYLREYRTLHCYTSPG